VVSFTPRPLYPRGKIGGGWVWTEVLTVMNVKVLAPTVLMIDIRVVYYRKVGVFFVLSQLELSDLHTNI
jgi:hypothetical protein